MSDIKNNQYENYISSITYVDNRYNIEQQGMNSSCQGCYYCRWSRYSGYYCYSCYGGYYYSSYQCYSCPSNCYYCTNSSSCYQCNYSYYLLNSKCYECPSQCATCTSSTVCTGCRSGYYLSGTSCLPCQSPCSRCVVTDDNCTGCIRGYYLTGNTCSLCSKPCTACTISATQCTACLEPINQSPPTCDCTSPAKYLDPITLGCLNCVSPCLNCSSQSQCDSCVSQAYLLQSTVCIPCTKPCKQCSGSLTNCLSCIDTNQTAPSCNCNSGYLIDITTKMCNKCTYPCLACQTTLTYCLSCVATYTLDSVNHTCKCSNTYYEQSGSPKTCQLCLSPCLTCFSSSTHCLSCVTGLNRVLISNKCLCNQGYFESAGTCQLCVAPCVACTSLTVCTCIWGQYLDGTATCQPCSSPCYNCITVATTCLSCIDTYYLNGSSCLPCNNPCQNCIDNQTKCLSCRSTDQYLDNDTCNCFDGTYIDSSFICHNCAYPCSKCIDNANKCLDCVPIFRLSTITSYTCVCPDGFYKEILNNPQDCQPCMEPCETCSGNPNYCLSCQDSNQIVNTSQQCICKDGYFEVGHTCDICQPPCSKCEITATQCTECISTDRQVIDYQCVCLDGYGQDGNGCSPCLYPCEKCSTSITTCTSCIDTGQYTLFNSQCICNQHFYQLNNQCYQCSPQCNTCINNQNYCTSCSDINHLFLQNECFCTPGYYTGLSMECIECNSPCATCTINFDYCTSCVSELYNLIDNHCYCIDGYYFDQTDCQLCKSICTKCKTYDSCQECIQGYYYTNNQCLKCHISCYTCISESQNCILCSNGYLMNDEGKCVVCHQNCKTCETTYDNCISCRQHYDLINNICICHIGYYENDNQCVICPYPCLECNNPFICLKCDTLSQLQMKDNICKCDDGYYWNQIKCDVCYKTCQTCNKDKNYCLTCDQQLNRSIKSNKCECQTNYFEDDKEECIPCKSDQAKAVQSCQYSNCQDGLWTYGEECDDGNNVLRDGCSNCKLDEGFSCSNIILQPSQCIQCSSNCKQCKLNDSNFIECIQCNTGYFVYQQICAQCSYQCFNCQNNPSNCDSCRFIKNKITGLCELCESQPGYYSDFKNNKCTTICGDSFKSSNEECDDGNKIDGDGCDKYCRKEIHYLCKDGICIVPEYPQPILSIHGQATLFDSLRQFQLNYTKKLNVTNNFNITQYMQFYILNGDKKQTIYYPYTVGQFMGIDENNFKNLSVSINITLNQSSSNEILLIEFSNLQNIISQSGYPQIQTYVNSSIIQFVQIQEATKNKIEQTTQSGQYVLYSAGVMAGAAVFFGGLDIFYSLLDTIQMLSYFKYVNTQMPFNLQSFFELFGFAQLSFITKYLNVQEYIDKYVDYSQLKPIPQKIADDQFKSLFIINGTSILAVWITSLGTFFVAIIIKKFLVVIRPKIVIDNHKDDCFIKIRIIYLTLRIQIVKFCNVVVSELFFSGILRIQISTAYELLFSLFIQISALQFDSQSKIVCLSSYLALIGLGLYILQIFIVIQITHKAKFILQNESLIKKYGAIFEGVNQGYYSKYFNAFLLIKKLLFMGTLIIFYSGPIFQVVLLTLIQLMQNVFLVLFRPFPTSLEFFKQLICEINSFFTLLSLIVIVIDNDMNFLTSDQRENIGWLTITLISSILIIQLILDGSQQWSLLLRKKKYLRKALQKFQRCFKPERVKRASPDIFQKLQGL